MHRNEVCTGKGKEAEIKRHTQSVSLTQRDRQPPQASPHSPREPHTQTYIHTQPHTHSHTATKTYGHTKPHTATHSDIQTGRRQVVIDRQRDSEKQKNTHTNSHTHTHTKRHTHTVTHIEMHTNPGTQSEQLHEADMA